MQHQPSSLVEWLDYIESLHPATIELGLQRVQLVAERLQVCHFACPVITVAGTNGKGTTSAALHALLTQQQKRVGVYSSPHLCLFNERVLLGEQLIADQTLIDCFTQVEQARADIQLTYFEFTTLAALVAFKQYQPDYLILEVGLGGRLDAVNIVEPDVTIVTTIDYDHQAWLGDTLEQIATEKSGIYRAGVPVILAMPEPPKPLIENAQRLDAPLFCNGQAYRHAVNPQGLQWQIVDSERLKGIDYQDLPTSGIHPDNIAAALCAFQLLMNAEIAIDDVCKALQHVMIAGRFDTDSAEHPKRIIDVAHNAESARFLAQRLEDLNKHQHRKVTAIVSVLGDKDSKAIFAPFADLVEHWICIPLDCPRGQSAEAVADALQTAMPDVCYDCCDSFTDAIQLSESYNDDCVLVFGSFFMAALAYEHHFLPFPWKADL